MRFIGQLLVFLAVCGVSHAFARCEDDLKILPDEAPRTEIQLESHLSDLARRPDSALLKLEVARDYLDLAGQQRWHYLEKAQSILQELLNHHPNASGLLMMLGRTIGARALDQKPSTMTRLKWARSGFGYMDKAITLDGTCKLLRLQRGEAALMAHPILRRAARLEEDARMIHDYLQDQEFFSLPSYQQARVYLFLGNYYEKKKDGGKARELWQKAMDVALSSPYALEAQARLKGTWQGLGYEG